MIPFPKNAWTDRRMDGRMERQKDRWNDGWKDERTSKRMDKPYFIGAFQLPAEVQKSNSLI